ncbi:hypothetical protein BDZ94DRAFT_1315362 [Collybia nuda]|uniref:DUF6534 domain-containing protein n=1 Tax=Collybia nuda TaxID=64659 RepID=A0A9P5XTD7_9AGAR|nr:hypothetical protein BDZ94DRAFT_1315362 [Collybia nuda]
MQGYHYFSRFPQDPRGLKLMAIAVWIGAIGNVICIWWGMYTLTITDFGLAPELLGVPLAINIASGFASFVRSAVQAFYTYRMYKYSGSLYLPIICWSISAYEFVAGIILSVTWPTATFAVQLRYLDYWSWLLYSIFTSAASADIAIAASMCYYLLKKRNQGLKRTVRVIDRLVIWTIQTGLLTRYSQTFSVIGGGLIARFSVTAITITITYAVQKENFAWLGLLNFLTNLYPTALFTLLNGRSNLKADDLTTDIRPQVLASTNGTLDISSPTTMKGRPTQMQVTVEQEDFPLYHIMSDSRV